MNIKEIITLLYILYIIIHHRISFKYINTYCNNMGIIIIVQ